MHLRDLEDRLRRYKIIQVGVLERKDTKATFGSTIKRIFQK